MPPCQLSIRSLLLGSRKPATLSIAPFHQSQCRPILRHFSLIPVERSQQDSRIENDIDRTKGLAANAATLDGIAGAQNELALKGEDSGEPSKAKKRPSKKAFGKRRGLQNKLVEAAPHGLAADVNQALTQTENLEKPSLRRRIEYYYPVPAMRQKSRETTVKSARVYRNNPSAFRRLPLEDVQKGIKRPHSLRVKSMAISESVQPDRPSKGMTQISTNPDGITSGRLRRSRAVSVPQRPVANADPAIRTRDTSYWHAEYSRLDRRYDPKLPQTYLQDPGPPRTPLNARATIAAVRRQLQVLQDCRGRDSDSDTARIERESLGILLGSLGNLRFHRARWDYVAIWFLYHEPEQAIELLAATASRPYLRSSSVMQSIQYLVLHLSQCQDEGHKAQHLARLAEVLLRLVERRSNLQLRFEHGGALRHLLPYCDQNQMNALWDAIREKRIATTWKTLLHVARRLIDTGEFSRGLDAILEAHKLDAEVDSYALRSSCAHLLRVASRQPSGLRVTLRLVDNFVAMGLTLNSQMCNIVILNAIEGGDLDTAFSLYRSLVQNGLEADHVTYGILLKGCRGIDDADLLNETIRSAIAHVNVQQNEQLATEILNCLALFHSKKDPDNAFNIIAEAYTQLFDPYPLRMLGVLKPTEKYQRRMPSTHQAIGIMLSAHLEHVYSRDKSHHAAREIYDRYRELVLANAEPFASTIATDYLPNIFLHHFVRTRHGLLSASQVIKDMQRPTTSGHPVKQCLPTVQTWTIYLHGFTRHGKMELAEQVLTYMRNKGLEPDVVTWNNIVQGYAKKQDEEGLLGALDRLEEGGHEWTKYTVDGMKWYRKQEELSEVLRKREQAAVELSFVTDLKSQLRERFELEGDNGGEKTDVEYKPFA